MTANPSIWHRILDRRKVGWRSIATGSLLRYAAQLSRASSCVFCVALVDRARSLPRRRRVQQLFCPSLGAVPVSPSLRSVRPSVRAFFHSIDLPSAVSLSFHACAALPFRSNDRAREEAREGGPCRRCSPSSSLNTAAILLPDQVRSRCSLVCSLGWMERRKEGTWNKWSPLDPFSCSSSCSAHQLRLCHCHARWRVVPHPASTVRGSLRLEGLRGAVQEREYAQLLVLYVARLIPRPRASEYPRKYRTHVLWSLWLLARNDGHDHGCP